MKQQKEPPQLSKLTATLKFNCKPDTKLLRDILVSHYLFVGNAAGQYSLQKIIAAMRGEEVIREAAPTQQAGDASWSTSSRRYDDRKAKGLGARTGSIGGSAIGTPTMQELLSRADTWEALIEANPFQLRDPKLLQELRKRGTLIVGDISDTMLEDLRDTLAQLFYKEGVGIGELAKEIDKIFPRTYWGRAEAIARTETTFAQETVTYKSYVENGVPGKRWITLFRNSRDSHAAVNGQVRPIDKPFSVGGASMMHPGDEGAPAEEVINCNCDVDPVFEGEFDIPEEPWTGG